MLYFRQLLILFVGLYSVRVVLDVLGVEDYGIYNVVAGVVTMLSFLTATMASSTQRYFSFALGKNDLLHLKKIFSVNITIYIITTLIAFLIFETIGLWFIKQKLDIPLERFDESIIIYHFAVLMFVFNILTSPFLAIIIAHEDMQIYAFVSIIEAILKLGFIILLRYIDTDKLVLYGVLLLIVSIINAMIYITIAIKKYEECQFKKFYWDKSLIVDIGGFTGWTLLGQITTVFRTQAVTILINQFFNPFVVASRAIATTISNHIGVFASNFNTSLYPPIIKSYASNQKSSMFSLVFYGSKLTFFLIWIIALPFILEVDLILSLWLKNVPSEAALFTNLMIIESLIMFLSLPLSTAARAPGKMKEYELSMGIIQFSIFFVSLVVLKRGYPAYSVFIVAIAANIVMSIVRLFIVRKLIDLPIKQYLLNVVYPVFICVLITYITSYTVQKFLPVGYVFSAIVVMYSVLINIIVIYNIGLDKFWRNKIKNYILIKVSLHTKN